MQSYLDLMQRVLKEGNIRQDRTQTGTRSLFAERLQFDLAEGLPVVTTKKVHLKSVIYELLWMIRGETNIQSLNKNGVTIWDEWADEQGDLGPVYGQQWRSWKGDGKAVDQLGEVISAIKTRPESRRLIVSAWNAADVSSMALPPCHLLFQFYVHDNRLSCQMYQRSADLFLGVPFNIVSYALLTHMIAAITGLKPGKLTMVFGDVHLYENHLEQAKLQLTRVPRDLPSLRFLRIPEQIDDFQYEDISIEGYQPHPHIKAPVAV